jgi:hypothetical protein
VVIGVGVGAVEPDAGPEGKGTDEEEGREDASGRAAAGLVRNRGTTAVVPATAEAASRTATCLGAASDVGCR